MLGVADQYHVVDDVVEVNGFIAPVLPGSFLYKKEPGYKATFESFPKPVTVLVSNLTFQ